MKIHLSFIGLLLAYSSLAQLPQADWQFKLDLGGADHILSMTQTADKGWIAYGVSWVDPYGQFQKLNNYLLKIGAKGNLEWKVTLTGTFGSPDRYFDANICAPVVAMDNSAYYLAYNAGADHDGRMAKVSNSGTVTWDKLLN